MNETLAAAGLKSGDTLFVSLSGLVKEAILGADLQSKPLTECIAEHGTDYATPYNDKLVIWSVKSVAAAARSGDALWRQRITSILLDYALNYIDNRDRQNVVSKATKAALRIYAKSPKPADMTSIEAVNLLCLILAVDFDSTNKIKNYFGNKHIRSLLTSNFLQLIAERVLHSINEESVCSVLANFFASLAPNHDASLVIYDPSPFRMPIYKLLMNPVLQGALSNKGWLGAAAILFKVIMPTSVNLNNIVSTQSQSEFAKMIDDVAPYIEHIYPIVAAEWPPVTEEDEIYVSPLSDETECQRAVQSETTMKYIHVFAKYYGSVVIIAGWSSLLRIPYSVVRAFMHSTANKYSGDFSISHATKMICIFGMRVNSPWVYGYGSIDHTASIIATAITNLQTPMLYKKLIETNLTPEVKSAILTGLESGVGPYVTCRQFLSKNRDFATLFLSIAEIVRLLGSVGTVVEESSDSDSDSGEFAEMVRNAVARMIGENGTRARPATPETDNSDDDPTPANGR